jgi:hypothetical protein
MKIQRALPFSKHAHRECGNIVPWVLIRNQQDNRGGHLQGFVTQCDRNFQYTKQQNDTVGCAVYICVSDALVTSAGDSNVSSQKVYIRGLTIKFANFAIIVLHTSLLIIWLSLVAYKVLSLGSCVPMPAPNPPLKTILELVLWTGLQSCRRIAPDVISVIRLPSSQYFPYLREQKKVTGG